jgi:MbtH protein
MTDEPTNVSDTFEVVVNAEEQYSIWPSHTEPPAGWRREGTSGSKEFCLAHIETVWTDMRPLSVRMSSRGQTPRETGT